MEETKRRARELQLDNDKRGFKIKDLRAMLREKERKLTGREDSDREDLREVKQALIALDEEWRSSSREHKNDDGRRKVAELEEMLAGPRPG